MSKTKMLEAVARQDNALGGGLAPFAHKMLKQKMQASNMADVTMEEGGAQGKMVTSILFCLALTPTVEGNSLVASPTSNLTVTFSCNTPMI